MASSLFLDYFPDNPTPVFFASAPGRLDVMGGIADYSGSLVLQMPLREQTTVWLAPRTDGRIRAITRVPQVGNPKFFAHYDELQWQGRVNYAHARAQFGQLPGGDWAAYAVGCLLVLQHEMGIRCTGMDLLIDSQVPLGKGVSSSASLEVATLKALQLAFGLDFPGTSLPVLAQKVENLVVGAPCGLMDQLAAYFGQRDQLLPIRCQPDQLQPLVRLPPGLRFVGIDSGVRHAVGGASYGQVRTAAFMGYSLIAHVYHRLPAPYLTAASYAQQPDRLPYGGYLANIAPALFAKTYGAFLPEKMGGKLFKQTFDDTIDQVTQVEPTVAYPVLAATRHPVYENFRTGEFANLLAQIGQVPANEDSVLAKLGQLMYQSHQSYTDCGLGNPQTDELVDMVRQRAGQGVFGAKITGGGSGGTVCVMCYGERGLDTARTIHREYSAKYGPVVFFE